MWLINELISNIECRDSLILKGVERIRRKELITGDDLLECKDLEVLRLTLSEGDVCFLCLGETDEIEISAIPNDWDNLHVLDLSQQNPWIDLIDKPLFSIWQLINARGWLDGFQLEFGPAESSQRIQIDCAGSTIRTFIVSRLVVK